MLNGFYEDVVDDLEGQARRLIGSGAPTPVPQFASALAQV